MPAYIEVYVKGGGRAYIDAGGIAVILTGRGFDVHTKGTSETPVRVGLRVGETLDVLGESAGNLLVRCYQARLNAKNRKAAAVAAGKPDMADDFWVDYLPTTEEVE